MHSLANRVLSWLFYGCYRLGSGRWVIAVLLLWFGWFQLERNPGLAYVTLGILVGFVLLVLTAQACSYVILRRSDRQVQISWHAFPDMMITTATGHFTRVHRLGKEPHFAFNLPVQLRWQKEYHPPFLAVTSPVKLKPNLVYAEEGCFAEWYPGSEVEAVWFWVAGREVAGVRVAFAGRWLLIELEEFAVGVVEDLLAG